MSTHAANPLGTPNIETTRWRIDPARSSVEFRAPAFWGLLTVKGRFSRYQGTLDLSDRPAVELTIQADSPVTKNEKRDAHLRSPDRPGAGRSDPGTSDALILASSLIYTVIGGGGKWKKVPGIEAEIALVEQHS